jgi:hypothetical protein
MNLEIGGARNEIDDTISVGGDISANTIRIPLQQILWSYRGEEELRGAR